MLSHHSFKVNALLKLVFFFPFQVNYTINSRNIVASQEQPLMASLTIGASWRTAETVTITSLCLKVQFYAACTHLCKCLVKIKCVQESPAFTVVAWPTSQREFLLKQAAFGKRARNDISDASLIPITGLCQQPVVLSVLARPLEDALLFVPSVLKRGLKVLSLI